MGRSRPPNGGREPNLGLSSNSGCTIEPGCAAQKKKTAQPLKSRMIAIISTKLGGISPSILVMQTTEYGFRKYRSSLGYGFHLAVCRRFLLNLIGNTWS